jgi:hypothetical protein
MVIRRGRRREHPNQHCLLLLRVLHNFRLRMHTPKGTPKGSSDLWSHPVAMLLLLRKKRGGKAGHAQNLLPVRATSGQGHFMKGQVTFGSHVTTIKKKAREKAGHAQNILPDSASFGQVHFRSCV